MREVIDNAIERLQGAKAAISMAEQLEDDPKAKEHWQSVKEILIADARDLIDSL